MYIALDMTGTDPEKVAERVDRLCAAVEECVERTLPVVRGGGGAPASAVNILDKAIKSILDASASAQDSTGSVTESAVPSA